MKKFMLIILAVTFVMAFAVSSYAAQGSFTSAGGSIGSQTYKPSTNVTVHYGTAQNAFCATAYHGAASTASGGYKYGVLSSDSAMKRLDISSTAATGNDCSADGTTLSGSYNTF
jgi:hypothetical protein